MCASYVDKEVRRLRLFPLRISRNKIVSSLILLIEPSTPAFIVKPRDFSPEANDMARHRLTKEEQQKGVKKALESPRTPPQLKKGLKKREQQLEGSNNSSGKKSGASDSEE